MGELNVNKLNGWISELIQTKATDLFRYKGVLAVKGVDYKFVFQGVHMLFSGGLSREVAKWDVPEGERESRFVFIGRNLDKKALEDGFMACKAKENLRFKVGGRVLANRGQEGFKKGKVLKHWDEGNAYRVELIDGTNVWAPI